MLLDLVADSRLIDMQGVLLLGTYQLDRREEASLAFMLQVRSFPASGLSLADSCKYLRLDM
jgi:hypothetical protein